MICQNCKKDFYASNKDRKYCSTSCRSIVNNKLRAKPKVMKKAEIKHNIEWKRYWDMYFMGWISIQDVKNMMRETYVSNKAKDEYKLFAPNNIEL